MELNEPTQDEIVAMVCSRFTVTGINRGIYSMELRIADLHYGDRFADLVRDLRDEYYKCTLLRQDGELYIVIQRFIPPKPNRLLRAAWTPRLLFVLVCTLVMVDGYYRGIQINQITYMGHPLFIAFTYTLALLGILGTHEAGHLLAARMHRIRTTWPFFIPGIPIIGIPTFGAFIQAQDLTINRKILFDVAIAGPVAGAVVAVIVLAIGVWTAPVLDDRAVEVMSTRGLITEFEFGKSILLYGMVELFDKGSHGLVINTPILWASWIGFLITFLNLLPAWQLDGGHIARTLLGRRLHQYATYASMLVLVLLNYWVMALLILVLSLRNPSATPLDDITPLSSNRKIAYIGIIVLAALCAPLPVGLLS